MGRQRGPLRIEGTYEDLTFYKVNGRYAVKAKSEVPASRIKNDPAYARTRENNNEFATSAHAAKLIYNTLREIITGGTDAYVFSRLMGRARQVLKNDTVNPRGERTVADGDLSLFTGFNFNKYASLSEVAAMTFTPSIDRVTGKLEVAIPAYSPQERIHAPEGTTHYRFLAIGAEFSFSNATKKAATADSGYLPWNNVATAPLTLTATLPANSLYPLFLFLGIEFYQLVNSTYYSLNDGPSNPLAVMQVDF